MSKMWIIARKDIGEAFRSRTTYLYIAILFFLSFTYTTGFNALLNRLTNEGAGHVAIYEAGRAFLNGIVYVLPAMYSFFVCTTFAAYAVILEKSRRNIETLLATPLTLREMWLGKTLGVTVPSVIIALIIAIVSYLAFDYFLVVPRVGTFIWPSVTAILTALVLVPLLIFSIAALVIYLQLVLTNPRIANLAFTAIFLALLLGGNAVASLGVSLNYPLVYAAVAAITGLVAFLLSRSLTRERVILSSKT
jgi:ABC-2 type transport system permease protein